MKKRRKIGRYIVLLLLVFVLMKIYRRPRRIVLPDLPEQGEQIKIFKTLKEYPHFATSVSSISKYGFYTKKGQIIYFGGGDWRLKLAVADSIISANWHFRILDLQHDGWAILRR